jgi:hypothetical protein
MGPASGQAGGVDRRRTDTCHEMSHRIRLSAPLRLGALINAVRIRPNAVLLFLTAAQERAIYIRVRTVRVKTVPNVCSGR